MPVTRAVVPQIIITCARSATTPANAARKKAIVVAEFVFTMDAYRLVTIPAFVFHIAARRASRLDIDNGRHNWVVHIRVVLDNRDFGRLVAARAVTRHLAVVKAIWLKIYRKIFSKIVAKRGARFGVRMGAARIGAIKLFNLARRATSFRDNRARVIMMPCCRNNRNVRARRAVCMRAVTRFLAVCCASGRRVYRKRAIIRVRVRWIAWVNGVNWVDWVNGVYWVNRVNWVNGLAKFWHSNCAQKLAADLAFNALQARLGKRWRLDNRPRYLW